MVHVSDLDGSPQTDPLRTGMHTETQLTISPESETCWIEQVTGSASAGVSSDEHHGVILTAILSGHFIDESEVRGFLDGETGQDLLDRVVCGHEVAWDGHNHVGVLDDDAERAFSELVSSLDGYCVGPDDLEILFVEECDEVQEVVAAIRDALCPGELPTEEDIREGWSDSPYQWDQDPADYLLDLRQDRLAEMPMTIEVNARVTMDVDEDVDAGEFVARLEMESSTDAAAEIRSTEVKRISIERATPPAADSPDGQTVVVTVTIDVTVMSCENPEAIASGLALQAVNPEAIVEDMEILEHRRLPINRQETKPAGSP